MRKRIPSLRLSGALLTLAALATVHCGDASRDDGSAPLGNGAESSDGGFASTADSGAAVGSGNGSSGGGGGGGVADSGSFAPDAGDRPTPPPQSASPVFGPNVLIFDPAMPAATIQSRLDDLYSTQDADQFGAGRYAYFFKPGSYALDVKVGFYTQVLGLGASPDDVTIRGAVRAKADWLGNNNATCNFWRGAENLAVEPSGSIDGGTNVWAVSQGTHLRRLHVKGDMKLDDGGWSSGGFIADSVIDGTLTSGTQQQFLTRNSDDHWQGSNWNMVFVGDANPPSGGWPSPPFTVVADTPVVREKPYVYLDANGHYALMVPALKKASRGHGWGGASPGGASIPFTQIYVAKPGVDNAASLNAALAKGLHLVLTPGTYHLEKSLEVPYRDTVLLGLGLATLVPDNGTPAISVADVDGVTLASILLEAGPKSSPTLLAVGAGKTSVSHAANPSALFDVHCRVGGASDGTAASCVTVNSNDVLIDNAWLWRADHGADAAWDGNVSANGIIVNGDHVTAYGLFVEHFQQFQTLWNGNGGAVYFYQSEMPYDPPNQAAWKESADKNGFPSYKVSNSVTSHIAQGIGVYSVFSNDVNAANAIETPTGAAIVLRHMMSVSLAAGTISHIANGTGGSVGNGAMTAYSTQ